MIMCVIIAAPLLAMCSCQASHERVIPGMTSGASWDFGNGFLNYLVESALHF